MCASAACAWLVATPSLPLPYSISPPASRKAPCLSVECWSIRSLSTNCGLVAIFMLFLVRCVCDYAGAGKSIAPFPFLTVRVTLLKLSSFSCCYFCCCRRRFLVAGSLVPSLKIVAAAVSIPYSSFDYFDSFIFVVKSSSSSRIRLLPYEKRITCDYKKMI